MQLPQLTFLYASSVIHSELNLKLIRPYANYLCQIGVQGVFGKGSVSAENCVLHSVLQEFK